MKLVCSCCLALALEPCQYYTAHTKKMIALQQKKERESKEAKQAFDNLITCIHYFWLFICSKIERTGCSVISNQEARCRYSRANTNSSKRIKCFYRTRYSIFSVFISQDANNYASHAIAALQLYKNVVLEEKKLYKKQLNEFFQDGFRFRFQLLF